MAEYKTVFSYNGVDFTLDLADADTQEAYERAAKEFATFKDELSADETAVSQFTRIYCAKMRAFFDAILGVGANEKLFNGCKDNMIQYTKTYNAFLDFVAKQTTAIGEETKAVVKKYSPKSKKAKKDA